MCELRTRPNDKVIEAIAIIDQSRIDPIDDFYSFYLLLLGYFFRLFQAHTTVDDEFLRLDIDRIIDDDINGDDSGIDCLDRILDLIVEFSSQIVPME